MTFRTFIVTLTLTTTILLLHKTLQLMMMYNTIKFGCKKISSSVNMVEAVISDYMGLHCGLDHILLISFFCMTLLLVIVHHLTKFG